MTGKPNTGREALIRLADLLVDDVFAATDKDILAEAAEDRDDPEKLAAAMRRLFEETVNESGKARMAAARVAVGAARQQEAAVVKLDPVEARRRLKLILAGNPETARKLTLAARKAEELSDDDVRSILEDLEELGLVPRSDNRGGKS